MGRVDSMFRQRRSRVVRLHLEHEVLSRQNFETKPQPRAVVLDWCRHCYYARRQRSSAALMPPNEYEKIPLTKSEAWSGHFRAFPPRILGPSTGIHRRGDTGMPLLDGSSSGGRWIRNGGAWERRPWPQDCQGWCPRGVSVAVGVAFRGATRAVAIVVRIVQPS
jgi:hypothetical protein